MRRFELLAMSLVALCCGSICTADDDLASAVGKRVEAFTLPDVHGKPRSLAEYDGKLVVLAFVGTECPLAKSYAPRLRDLAQEFQSQGVVFLGIDSNMQDTLTEMAALARATGIAFPILKDTNNELADRLGAERTPEVFLLDAQHTVRYRGRIDDQYGFKTGAGYVKPKLSERSLADAITQVIQGKPVERPVVKADGCLIGRVVKQQPQGDVTYTNQIARLMQKSCVECHRDGELAPFTLTSYDDAVAWAGMMREVVNDGRMPPWFADPAHGKFANDRRLSDEEKQQLSTWIDNGCPQGDPQQLPEPRQFAKGWQIGTPDQIFEMRDTPFKVPAEGTIGYKFFAVDPGWSEDKWVCAAEARPGNARVVHHIITSAVPKGSKSSDPLAGVGLGGYAPGTVPVVCPPGMAIHVPAGSKIVFQLHYTSNGTPEEDKSLLGLRFVDPKTVKQSVVDGLVGHLGFRIPAGAADHEVKNKFKISKDALLLDLTPHMHLRGKSFRFEAQYPDGTREILLDVPNYDFNWQLTYTLAEPKLLPKGTWLHAIAHFDNSAENAANPDPTKVVTFGEQTWEEMMFGFYSTIDPAQDLTASGQVGQ